MFVTLLIDNEHYVWEKCDKKGLGSHNSEIT